jgi:putative transposase
MSPQRINLGGFLLLSVVAFDGFAAPPVFLDTERRDTAAAKRFFRRVLRSNPVPRKIVTDQLRSYPAAKAEIPELANVKHVFVKAAARVNNRAENSHQPTCQRERRMRGFRDPKGTQNFLSCFGPIRCTGPRRLSTCSSLTLWGASPH